MEATAFEQRRNNRNMRLLCIWSAVPMAALLFTGIIIAGVMPPQPPSDTVEQIAERYRTDTAQVRGGLALSFFGIIFFFAFGAAIAAQIRRIEGLAPVLTYVQIAAFASGSLTFIIPWLCWETAAFRPEREASEIALLHDLGWMAMVFAYVAFTAWNFAIGLAVLSDTATRPVYPRWYGYFNILVGWLFVTDNLVVFFKDGPLAWDGLLTYWVPFIMYGNWIVVSVWLTVRAIHREAADDTADTGVTGAPPVSALVDLGSDLPPGVPHGRPDESPLVKQEASR